MRVPELLEELTIMLISLAKIAKNLGRIADALDRAVPVNKHEFRVRGAEALTQYGQKTWKTERAMELVRPLGLSSEEEKRIVSALVEAEGFGEEERGQG